MNIKSVVICLMIILGFGMASIIPFVYLQVYHEQLVTNKPIPGAATYLMAIWANVALIVGVVGMCMYCIQKVMADKAKT